MDLQKNHFHLPIWLVVILGFSFLLFVGSYKKNPRKDLKKDQKDEMVIENEAGKKECDSKVL